MRPPGSHRASETPTEQSPAEVPPQPQPQPQQQQQQQRESAPTPLMRDGIDVLLDAPTLVLPVILAEPEIVEPPGRRGRQTSASASRSAGRRAAPRKQRHQRRGMTASAALGGATLVLAGIAAVTLDQPASQAATQGFRPVSSTTHRPSDSLYSRSLPRTSRSANRAALETAAEQTAAARRSQLASASTAAKSYGKALASQEWVLPTTGFHITTWFGERGWYWDTGYHTGIDFATACDTPEIAVTAGVVAQAGWDGPYGYQVRLTLPNGDQVWYNHMVEIKTHVGAHLAKGGLVGLVGETGNAYGCHLHFEYRLKSDLDTAVNPYPFFLAHGIDLHAPEQYR